MVKMKVYLLADESLYQWTVERIFSSREKADKFRNELLEPYEFDASNYYNIYEIELDEEIEELIGIVI